MTRLSIAQTAFGAALGFAVTLTTAVAPAFAETPKIDVIPSNPTIHRDLGPLPQPEATTVMFYPDVRVNYLSKSAGSGGKITYRFGVQNTGAASADNVGLGTVIGQRSNDGSVSTRQEGSAGSIASLGQDESQVVEVVCTPLPGYRCDGAGLRAYVTDDLDPDNNAAGSK